MLGSIAWGVTPATAAHAVDVAISASSPTLVVGAPQLTLTYSGRPPRGTDLPAFAQIEDDANPSPSRRPADPHPGRP